MSASQPSAEDLRNREMFKAMFSTPLDFVEESLEDLGLACERLLAKIVETVEKNKRTGAASPPPHQHIPNCQPWPGRTLRLAHLVSAYSVCSLQCFIYSLMN